MAGSTKPVMVTPSLAARPITLAPISTRGTGRVARLRYWPYIARSSSTPLFGSILPR